MTPSTHPTPPSPPALAAAREYLDVKNRAPERIAFGGSHDTDASELADYNHDALVGYLAAIIDRHFPQTAPTPVAAKVAELCAKLQKTYDFGNVMTVDDNAYVYISDKDLADAIATLRSLGAEVARLRAKVDEIWGEANYRLKYLCTVTRALGLEYDNQDPAAHASAAAEVARTLTAELARLRLDGEIVNWPEKRGVQSIYFNDEGQINPASLSLRAAIGMELDRDAARKDAK